MKIDDCCARAYRTRLTSSIIYKKKTISKGEKIVFFFCFLEFSDGSISPVILFFQALVFFDFMQSAFFRSLLMEFFISKHSAI